MSAVPKPPVYPRLAGTPSITPGHGLYVSLDQDRPELVLRTPASSFGSMPSLQREWRVRTCVRRRGGAWLAWSGTSSGHIVGNLRRDLRVWVR